MRNGKSQEFDLIDATAADAKPDAPASRFFPFYPVYIRAGVVWNFVVSCDGTTSDVSSVPTATTWCCVDDK